MGQIPLPKKTKKKAKNTGSSALRGKSNSYLKELNATTTSKKTKAAAKNRLAEKKANNKRVMPGQSVAMYKKGGKTKDMNGYNSYS